MEKKVLNAECIMSTIRNLAMSQGFYGRLLRDIEQCPEILDDLVAQEFTDDLDLILYLEC